MLKQMFGQNKKLQKEVVSLSNAFSYRLDNIVDTSNKENIISHRQTKNAISLWLLNTEKNRVLGYLSVEKKTLEKNKVTSHSKIEEEATKRNEVTGHFKKRERIECVNRDIFKISFLDQKMTKCNW